MEVLPILGLFIVLAVLAQRFGHDSRQRPASVEEAFACLVLAWHGELP